MHRFLVPCFFLILLAGCGYHPQGRGQRAPGGARTVYVDLLANATLEPFLENTATEALLNRFSRGRTLRVVDAASRANAVLSGRVASYTTVPVSYARNDEILEYRSTMTVLLELRRAGTGELLWKGNASWSEEYAASRDRSRQEDNEAAAIRVISDRIAEELYFRLVEDF